MNRDTINQLLLKYEFLSIEGEQLVIAWENVVSQLMNYTSLLVDNLMAISSSIYTVVFQIFVGMIAAFYLLMDRERYCAQVKKLCYGLFSTTTCETLIYWTRRAHKIFSGFITGKILDSMIIGIICYIVCAILQMPYALLVSVIVGVTNVIPFFGPYLGAIPSFVLILTESLPQSILFLVFIVILQQVDGNIIGPKILGDYTGISPLLTMIAIILGSALFGFVGMLISVPVCAVLYAIFKTAMNQRLEAKGLPTDTQRYDQLPVKE